MDVARLTFFALFALQHRGQESAGIAVTDGSRLDVHKDMGLVSQVFQEEMLQSLPGRLAIGHVRYSTTGSSEMRNAQPFARTRDGSFIALAHNGNLVNTDDSARQSACENGHIFESTSDTEVIAALLAEHPSHDIREALREVIPKLRGAFSAVLLTKDEVIGFRDPYGVRPLVLGEIEGRYCLASETSGLDIIGAQSGAGDRTGRDLRALRERIRDRAGGGAQARGAVRLRVHLLRPPRLGDEGADALCRPQPHG